MGMRILKVILAILCLLGSLFACIGAWHAFAEPPRSWIAAGVWALIALSLDIGAVILLKVPTAAEPMD